MRVITRINICLAIAIFFMVVSATALVVMFTLEFLCKY